MHELKIEFTDKLNKKTIQRMCKGFIDYEKAHEIDINYQEFAFVLSDRHKTAFGVLSAYTSFEEIYVDDIWVDESVRGKGYGKQLLNTLENHFKGKGYQTISLMTFAFQAPEFYKKCGYDVEFLRENKANPKVTKFYFIKYL